MRRTVLIGTIILKEPADLHQWRKFRKLWLELCQKMDLPPTATQNHVVQKLDKNAATVTVHVTKEET